MTDIATLEARVAELERMLGVGAPVGSPVPPWFLRSLLKHAAAETALHVDVITSDSRVQEHVRARWAIVWVARSVRGTGYARIGRALGGRDHSSIAHAERRAIFLRETDPDFRELTDTLADVMRQMQS
jgi:chromosomal replication initiator protein